MTPKEKAKELIDKYSFVEIANYTSMFEVKQCALIAVDELIKNEYQLVDELLNIIQDNKIKLVVSLPDKSYWESVKIEIQKL
jgi:hypothetical protein